MGLDNQGLGRGSNRAFPNMSVRALTLDLGGGFLVG